MKITKSIFSFVWNFSIGKFYRMLFKRSKRIILPKKEFLESQRYTDIMDEFIPYNMVYGKFESSTYTRSYINRHHTHFHQLGVFRWRGMQENLSMILPFVSDYSKTVIDLGGAGCPLGFNSILVDRLKKDITGKKVNYHALNALNVKADIIFACHVLEHIKNLDEMLKEIKTALKPEGILICMVPSFSNKYWNAGIHKNRKFGGHAWTFGLSTTNREIIKDYPFYLDINSKIEEFLLVEKLKYCGDDSIFVIAKNLI